MGCKEGGEEEVGRGGREEGRGGVVEEMAKNATIFACAGLRWAPSVPTALQPSCCLHLLSGGQDGEDDDDSLLGDDDSLLGDIDVEDIGENDDKEGEEEDNERDVEVEGGANLTAAKLPAAFLIRGRDSRALATTAPIGGAFGT